MRERIINSVKENKIIVIVRGVYGDDCLNLAKALNDGGIKLLEVTFDQKNSELWRQTADTITLLTKELGDRMYFGAGTVTSVQLVDMAKNAGADFIVSPDTNPDVIAKTVELGMVSMPGALTPTEVLTAHRAGADFVKLFPVSSLGTSYIKAVCAPLNNVSLLAVGGVDQNNAGEFIKAGAVAVGCGGKLVNKEWIKEGKLHEFTALAKKFVQSVKE